MKDINKELVKLSAIQDIMGDSFQHVDYGMLLKEAGPKLEAVKKFVFETPRWMKGSVGKAKVDLKEGNEISKKLWDKIKDPKIKQALLEESKAIKAAEKDALIAEKASQKLRTQVNNGGKTVPKKTKGTSPKTVADTSAPSTTPKPPTSQGSGGGLGKYVTGALGIGAGAGGMAIYNKENKPDPDNFDKMRGMYDNVFGK